MLRKILVTLLALSLALIPMTVNAQAQAYTIGFAVSTLENPFFVTMKDAAEAKAAELGVTLMVLDAQDSAETQASQVEDLITRGVDLMIINPVDSDAIGTSVIACNNASIPVITVTRSSNSGTVVQHLDIDNKEAGKLDAEQLIKDLGGKGKVAILEGFAGSSSAIDREEGFVAALEGSQIEVVASLTANYSREEGATVTEDILQSNPELDAIYAHNDEMALGAVRSVAAAGRSAEIKIYGIDATDDALAAVESGEMAATVQQQPDVQIQIALENAVKYLDGETLEPLVNIPLKLIVKQ
ncbi:MAG: D-ribose ABC transporter substrate-binding protein [Clostridiales bacterium]|nr:D-ribose ABC transporter substrate-binding protein [Clostridiales bacterium]